MMKKKKSDTIKDWIFDYISEHGGASATDERFHDEFHRHFGGKFQPTFYGAQLVYKAQRYLKEMYDEGLLDRRVMTSGAENISGFPNWEYVYFLSTGGRRSILSSNLLKKIRKSL